MKTILNGNKIKTIKINKKNKINLKTIRIVLLRRINKKNSITILILNKITKINQTKIWMKTIQ